MKYLASAALAVFTVMLGVGIVSPILPLYATNLGATGIWIGLIFSIFSFSRFLFLPVFGKIGDEVGKKKVILVGLVFYAIMSFAYILTSNLLELTAVRLLHGIASAMVIPVALGIVAERAKRGSEAFSMGVMNQAIFLGMAAGPLVGGVIGSFAIELSFASMGILSLIASVLVLFTFPADTGKRETRFRKVMESKIVRAAILFRILNAFGRGSVMSFFPIYLALLGYDLSFIGLAVTLTLLMSAFMQPLAGKLADSIDMVKPVFLGTTLTSLLLFAIVRVETLTAVLAASIGLGLVSGIALPAVSAAVAINSRGHESSAMGLLSASKSLGRMIGPLTIGIIYDLAGGGVEAIRTAFLFASAMTFLAGVVFVSMAGKAGREEMVVDID